MAETEQFRCTIKRMFNNCPKPDGWFGCFAHIRGKGDIKLTGKTTGPLTQNMVLDVKAEKIKDDEYKIESFAVVTKTTKGTIAYLSSIKGIGKLTATRIVENVPTNDILSIIRKGHAAVKKISDIYGLNLSDQQINNMVEHINNMDIKNRLAQFLPELTTSAKYIERIYQAFPVNPIEKIQKNPYILLTIQGISFNTADAVALRLGVPEFSEDRIGHGITHLISSQNSGNLYINLSDTTALYKLKNDTESLLQIKFTNLKDFGNYLIAVTKNDNFDLMIDDYHGEKHLYNKSLYENMKSLVHAIKLSAITKSISTNYKFSINTHISEYEQMILRTRNQTLNLNKEQRTAVKNSIENKISIITGGPGRGKTSMIDCLAYCWRKIIPGGNIVLLAPTGKAMNKLKNATSDENGTKYETRTVDNLIVMMNHINNDPFKNKKYASIKKNTYYDEKTMVIVDESSMIDIEKAALLLRNLPLCQFCFVGDADQLPPISPGTFFKDVIDAALPYVPITRLITPLRNKGCILDNANKVNNNDTNLRYDPTDMPFFPQDDDDESALEDIIDIYNDERMETPDITQIAMLCPVRKGLIGSDNINMTIQNIMCPENKQAASSFDKRRNQTVFITKGYPIPDTFFGNQEKYTRLRVGDIIMNTKNNTNIETVHYDKNDYWNGNPVEGSLNIGIYNGDCGKIIAYIPAINPNSTEAELSHSHIIVQFFDGRFAELDITGGDADNLSLGYAMTVHKAQGCEYETVIYVSPKRLLSFKDTGFLSKNLIYTAFTRAKSKVILIGSKESVNECIVRNIPKMNSNFKERLCSGTSY